MKKQEKEAKEPEKGENKKEPKEEKIEKKLEEEKKEEKEEKKREMKKVDEITSIASKRGIFFQTANIYGGKAGFFTYGHLGKVIKLNWENLWRKYFLGLDDNFYEIQSNNILPEQVFRASGHIENFNDPMTQCKKCHFRFRADHFLEDLGLYRDGMSILEMNNYVGKNKLKCPHCGGELTEVKQFNMMFPVNIGFDTEKGFLSPETAQGAYISFKEEFQATRSRLPLGLAIIDKAYRNEISPRQMFFRLREFTQAELQIFFDSGTIAEHERWSEVANETLIVKFADSKENIEMTCEELNIKHKLPKFYLYYAAKIQHFYLNILKVPREKFRLRELGADERAFYNRIHFDIEVFLESLGGFKEVAGLHYRTDHDLKGHAKISGKNLEIFHNNKKLIPHVLELSFGVDRNIWVLLDVFYTVGKEGSMFKFPPRLAPFEAAVLPLVNKDGMDKLARDIFNDLKEDFRAVYDDSGSIGRRYARNDEIGLPFSITIDSESLKGSDVTIRDRDTTAQIRLKVSDLKKVLRKLINNEIDFVKAGKLIEPKVKPA
jgi:glycyl-tRNA synthetase